MTTEVGDLLDVADDGYLVFQACMGGKQHKLAAKIEDKFGTKLGTERRMGSISIQPTNVRDVEVVAMFAQHRYGRATYGSGNDDSVKRTCSFKKCLDVMLAKFDGRTVYFPYKIGCSHAGSRWVLYKQYISAFASKYEGKVVIVKLPRVANLERNSTMTGWLVPPPNRK